jgi:arylsulfate sulfotransferase
VKKPIRLLLIFFCLFQLLTYCSCKKSPSLTGAVNPVDTFTQSVYTIDSTQSPSAGTILTAPFNFSTLGGSNPGLLLVMSQSGKVLNKLNLPDEALDFARWTINGQTRYTYIEVSPTAFLPPGDLQGAGYAIIADSNLNTLQQINFIPYAQGIFPSNQGLDDHEFILISDSDYITLTYLWKTPTNIPAYLNPTPGVSILAPVIEEVQNGSVVFHWDGSDDTSFYANSIFDNDFQDTTTPQDYMHMNSIFIDPTDSNLICSMRHQDQIIKINKQTGAVMWRLGGNNSNFALTSDQQFLFQHDCTLTDSNQTLMLFDNGSAATRPYSRICEFHLNFTNYTVTSFKYFDIPEPFTELTGSVQKFGDEYFIGGGTAQYMLDVNYNTGEKIIEFVGNLASYRSFKYATP